MLHEAERGKLTFIFRKQKHPKGYSACAHRRRCCGGKEDYWQQGKKRHNRHVDTKEIEGDRIDYDCCNKRRRTQ